MFTFRATTRTVRLNPSFQTISGVALKPLAISVILKALSSGLDLIRRYVVRAGRVFVFLAERRNGIFIKGRSIERISLSFISKSPFKRNAVISLHARFGQFAYSNRLAWSFR